MRKTTVKAIKVMHEATHRNEVELAKTIQPPIDLLAVLAAMNTMSTDGINTIYLRLSILRMVEEANRWRWNPDGSTNEFYTQLKRILVNAGVKT